MLHLNKDIVEINSLCGWKYYFTNDDGAYVNRAGEVLTEKCYLIDKELAEVSLAFVAGIEEGLRKQEVKK